jgi:hypothetical protein
VSTVEQRAGAIYDWLVHPSRFGHGFTLDELLAGTGLANGSKTTAAIRRARDLAAADGLHFPPTMPPHFRYLVTDDPAEARRPRLRMHAIARGVERRADVGTDFMLARLAQLPAAEQRHLLRQQHTVTAIRSMQQVLDGLYEDEARELNGA